MNIRREAAPIREDVPVVEEEPSPLFLATVFLLLLGVPLLAIIRSRGRE
jgi:hypothetical protein